MIILMLLDFDHYWENCMFLAIHVFVIVILVIVNVNIVL